MNSSNNINCDIFSEAVAELAAQVEGSDGQWQAALTLEQIAAKIIARVDGVPTGQHVVALVFAAKLKDLWDSVTDRDLSRKFDAVVAELAAYAPSKTPEQVNDFATQLVGRADDTEFVDEWRVWALEQVVVLKNAWSPRLDLSKPPAELEQNFIDIFNDAARNKCWLRGMISKPDRFLEAVEVSAGHDRSVLESLISMSQIEHREWLEACLERDGAKCRREGKELFINDAARLSGGRDYHGNLHTRMLPLAAQVLLACRHAPAPQHLALAA